MVPNKMPFSKKSKNDKKEEKIINFTKLFLGEDGDKNLGADANGDATGESKDESGENGAKTGTSKPGDGEGELTKNVFFYVLSGFSFRE